MNRSSWALMMVLLGLGGCLLKPYAPVPSPDYLVEDRWAIIDTDSLTLFVRPQTYLGDARPVASNFFAVYLLVKNKSARPLAIPSGGFGVTVNQQQYDHVPLSIVLGSLQSGFYQNEYQDPFAPPVPETQSQALEKTRAQYYELVNSYFSFGDLLPGGTKEGYLFYNERIGRSDSFEFSAWGTRIHFLRH